MFLLTVIFVLISYIYLRHRNVRRRYQNLPPVYPGAWPILGHSQLLINYGDVSYLWNSLKKRSEIITKNGGIMTAYVGESLYFLVTDPNDCATIANQCPDKSNIYDYFKPWLGDGLFSASGEVWKRHRKFLNPAFNQQVLNSFIDIFNVQSRGLVDDLENEVGKSSFNHMKFLIKTTLETVYQTVIAIKPENDNIENKNAYFDEMAEMFNIVITRIQQFWFRSEFIYSWSSLKNRQDISVKHMTDTVNEIMNVKKAAEKTKEPKTEDKYKAYMDLLLEYSADGSLSYEEVRDEVNTILVTAYETSTLSLAYTLMLLGSHSAVQDKVYSELKEVFGNSFRDVDKEDLLKLVYLDAVIKESLRIYPTAPVILRRITKDIKLDNYTLPEGSGCVFLSYGLHHHPVWGADADQFRPERWLEPSCPPRNAYAAFGLGKRNCIGKTYSMMFMKIVLAHMLRRYTITADVTKLKLKLEAILKPHSGCLISIDKRTT